MNGLSNHPEWDGFADFPGARAGPAGASYEEGKRTRRRSDGNPRNDVGEAAGHRHGFMYRRRDLMTSLPNLMILFCSHPAMHRHFDMAADGSAPTILLFDTFVNRDKGVVPHCWHKQTAAVVDRWPRTLQPRHRYRLDLLFRLTPSSEEENAQASAVGCVSRPNIRHPALGACRRAGWLQAAAAESG